jgi:hypothetical protein
MGVRRRHDLHCRQSVPYVHDVLGQDICGSAHGDKRVRPVVDRRCLDNRWQPPSDTDPLRPGRRDHRRSWTDRRLPGFSHRSGGRSATGVRPELDGAASPQHPRPHLRRRKRRSGDFVAEDHGPVGSFSYEIILTATDSSGLKSSTSVTLPVGSDSSPPTAPGGLAAAAAGPVGWIWIGRLRATMWGYGLSGGALSGAGVYGLCAGGGAGGDGVQR